MVAKVLQVLAKFVQLLIDLVVHHVILEGLKTHLAVQAMKDLFEAPLQGLKVAEHAKELVG